MNISTAFRPAFKPAVMGLLLLASGVASADAAKNDATREKVRKQSGQVLERLYAAKPDAREVVAKSAGYATFSRWGLTLGAVGGSLGKGLAVTQPAGKETFMRFVEGSAGVGLGIKKYDITFVFQTQKAMNDFVNKGWEAGGQATAAAKSGTTGSEITGAVSVSPGVWVYQITDKGLAAELGIKGTKYYKDKALNK